MLALARPGPVNRGDRRSKSAATPSAGSPLAASSPAHLACVTTRDLTGAHALVDHRLARLLSEQRPLGRKERRERVEPLEGRGRIVHLVHHPDPQGPVGVDQLGRVEQVLRRRRARTAAPRDRRRTPDTRCRAAGVMPNTGRRCRRCGRSHAIAICASADTRTAHERDRSASETSRAHARPAFARGVAGVAELRALRCLRRRRSGRRRRGRPSRARCASAARSAHVAAMPSHIAFVTALRFSGRFSHKRRHRPVAGDNQRLGRSRVICQHCQPS